MDYGRTAHQQARDNCRSTALAHSHALTIGDYAPATRSKANPSNSGSGVRVGRHRNARSTCNIRAIACAGTTATVTMAKNEREYDGVSKCMVSYKGLVYGKISRVSQWRR